MHNAFTIQKLTIMLFNNCPKTYFKVAVYITKNLISVCQK